MKKRNTSPKPIKDKKIPYLRISIIIILTLIIIVAILLLLIQNFNTPEQVTPQETEYLYQVTEIIDGDTLVIERGNYIRLIGINAPEKNQKLYNESKDFLSSLVLNKEVRVEKDLDNSDNYGRLLRYLFLKLENGEEIMINSELVKEGLAKPLTIEPNTLYQEEIENAWKICLKSSVNLCK